MYHNSNINIRNNIGILYMVRIIINNAVLNINSNSLNIQTIKKCIKAGKGKKKLL